MDFRKRQIPHTEGMGISDHFLHRIDDSWKRDAKTEDLFKNPLHPYTKGLLDAVPIPSLKAKKLSTEVMRGELTSPVDPAPGCRFAARCPYATDACRGRDIPLKEVEPGHFVSCTRF